MADDEEFEFAFDSQNLDDIDLDPEELAEFGLGGDAEDNLINELDQMAMEDPRDAAVKGNFGMIRTKHNDADYNVDNVVLTAEDENDPGLLAELRALQGDAAPPIAAKATLAPSNEEAEPVIIEEKEEAGIGLPLEVKLQTKDRSLLEKYVHLEKIKAVTCKRAGDTLGATEALKAYKILQTKLAEMDEAPPKQPSPAGNTVSPKPLATGAGQSIDELKRAAIEAKRVGDLDKARQLMTQIVQLEQKGAGEEAGAERIPKPNSASPSKAKTKEYMEKLVTQVEQCLDTAKYYLKCNSMEEASGYVSKKKAFESDLMAVKAAFQAGKSLPKPRVVTVELPVVLEHDEVEEGLLMVTVAGVKASGKDLLRTKAKELMASKSDYYLRVVFEWPSNAADETHYQRLSPTFKINSPITENFSFPGIKTGDLKCQKFFEHQRIRFELYKKETSFLLKSKSILMGSVQLKLNTLITQPMFEAKGLDILDGNRRSLGATIDVTMKLRRPLSNKVASMKSVLWTVFDELSSGRLFIGFITPASSSASGVLSRKQPVIIGSSGPGDDVDPIVQEELDFLESYAVMEHELEQLENNPATTTDPTLTTKQMALEEKRDALGMSIEMGQLSFEAYVRILKVSMDKNKKRALEAKRAGDLDKAKTCLKHVQLIEQEIASATEGAADD